MREMGNNERKRIEYEVTEIMESAVSREYARHILELEDVTGNTVMDDIIKNVLETSAWEEEGYYSYDDIRFAIGRILMARLGVKV